MYNNTINEQTIIIIGGIIDSHVELAPNKTYLITNSDLLIGKQGKLIVRENTTLNIIQHSVVHVKGQLDFVGGNQSSTRINVNFLNSSCFYDSSLLKQFIIINEKE